MTAQSPDAVLAVDVGGTKLAAGLVSPAGRLLRADRVATPVTDDPADGDLLWHELLQLVERVRSGAEVAGVGVGCGGPMAWPAGIVSPLNIPGWRGFPLRSRLAAAFPGVPVRVHNDAVCLAVAEHAFGAGRGHDDMIGMVVSTGVGAGLVLGGRVVSGATGNAGHLGHVVVDPGGPACVCGGHGCLEAVASGPRLTRWALDHGWRPSGAITPSAEAVAASARAGDPVARAAFDRAGRAVGVALASAVALCDVSVAVVGGGVAAAGELLFGPLREAYAHHAALDWSRSAQVVPALAEDPGLLGAAALVLRGSAYWDGD